MPHHAGARPPAVHRVFEAAGPVDCLRLIDPDGLAVRGLAVRGRTLELGDAPAQRALLLQLRGDVAEDRGDPDHGVVVVAQPA